MIAKDGRIRFDHASEEASSLFKKQLNRGHEDFINRRRTNPINQKYIVFGITHNLPEESRDCLVTSGVENAKIAHKYFDESLLRQYKYRRLKEELALAMK